MNDEMRPGSPLALALEAINETSVESELAIPGGVDVLATDLHPTIATATRELNKSIEEAVTAGEIPIPPATINNEEISIVEVVPDDDGENVCTTYLNRLLDRVVELLNEASEELCIDLPPLTARLAGNVHHPNSFYYIDVFWKDVFENTFPKIILERHGLAIECTVTSVATPGNEDDPGIRIIVRTTPTPIAKKGSTVSFCLPVEVERDNLPIETLSWTYQMGYRAGQLWRGFLNRLPNLS